VSGTMVGSLILEISGEENVLNEARAYFSENGVEIEHIDDFVPRGMNHA